MSKHLEQSDCLHSSESESAVQAHMLEPQAEIIATAIAAKRVPSDRFNRLIAFMDMAGVFASTLCMIHCLLLPILVALLPFIARPLIQHDWLHVGLAGFVLVFCLMAYVPGYLRHNDKKLLYVGACGLSLVFFATFVARQWGEIAEIGILTAGNTILVFGHLLNRKLLSHYGCKH